MAAHAVANDNTDGFLYLYEYNDKADFQLGLGGINAPIGDFDKVLEDYPCDANNYLTELIPIPGGGFYAIGTFTTSILPGRWCLSLFSRRSDQGMAVRRWTSVRTRRPPE